MKAFLNITLGLIATLAVIPLASSVSQAAAFAPSSFEVIFEPTYSLATGGPASRVGALGGGIRIGYEMVPMIAFELGGYYVDYVFGNVAGADQSAYAARGTADFAFAPTPAIRIYLGVDANAFFSPPASLTSTGNKDLGAIGGLRLVVGTGVKVLVGAEYRYAANTIFNYVGGSINNSAILGTVGIHFGGL